jgi:hypothetical protein
MRTALEGHQTFCANWSTRNPSAVRGSSATLPQYSLWAPGFFAESKVRFWPIAASETTVTTRLSLYAAQAAAEESDRLGTNSISQLNLAGAQQPAKHQSQFFLAGNNPPRPPKPPMYRLSQALRPTTRGLHFFLAGNNPPRPPKPPKLKVLGSTFYVLRSRFYALGPTPYLPSSRSYALPPDPTAWLPRAKPRSHDQ